MAFLTEFGHISTYTGTGIICVDRTEAEYVKSRGFQQSHEFDMGTGEIDIGDTIARLEEIAEILEEGTVDIGRARELREEADEHLERLRRELDVGDG